MRAVARLARIGVRSAVNRAAARLSHHGSLALELAGFGIAFAGVWMVFPPVALIVAGLVTVMVAQSPAPSALGADEADFE